MTNPHIPINEADRQAALNSYYILDTLPEEDYDNIIRLAAIICNTPIAFITLIDSDRQFFKAALGMDGKAEKRDFSFCAHAINKPDEPMIVPDARHDERFADNPYVTGDPHIVFYAGMPLVTPDGFALGSICVVDKKPNEISKEQTQALKSLSQQVIQLMELRKKKYSAYGVPAQAGTACDGYGKFCLHGFARSKRSAKNDKYFYTKA